MENLTRSIVIVFIPFLLAVSLLIGADVIIKANEKCAIKGVEFIHCFDRREKT